VTVTADAAMAPDTTSGRDEPSAPPSPGVPRGGVAPARGTSAPPPCRVDVVTTHKSRNAAATPGEATPTAGQTDGAVRGLQNALVSSRG